MRAATCAGGICAASSARRPRTAAGLRGVARASAVRSVAARAAAGGSLVAAEARSPQPEPEPSARLAGGAVDGSGFAGLAAARRPGPAARGAAEACDSAELSHEPGRGPFAAAEVAPERLRSPACFARGGPCGRVPASRRRFAGPLSDAVWPSSRGTCAPSGVRSARLPDESASSLIPHVRSRDTASSLRGRFSCRRYRGCSSAGASRVGPHCT